MRPHREAPPTAGLPGAWSDWSPWATSAVLRPQGIDHGLVVSSGTAAFVIALLALRTLSARRYVVVPAYTCPLVAIAIAHCGLLVRVCDTRPGHFDLDPAALAAACDKDTLAVVPTHLGGRPANVRRALACARAVGAWVIEDAAQAWGAKVDGEPVGLIGDIGFFSLAIGKGITLFEGGLLVARDPALREQLDSTARDILPGRWGLEVWRVMQLAAYTALYRPWSLRWMYGLPRRRAIARGNWIAAIGDDFPLTVSMHRVSRWRRRVGERAAARWDSYDTAVRQQAQTRVARIEQLPGAHVIGNQTGEEGPWPFFLVHLTDPQARDAILAELATSPYGISRLFIHALADYVYLRPIIDPADAVPNARAFAASTFTITNSLWLDDAAFEVVLATMGRVLRGFTTTPGAPIAGR